METRKKPISIILTIIVVIAAIVIVAVTVYRNSDTVKAQEQLQLGEKYMAELDYEQAIAAYNLAIETDPKNADAYLGLAYAYLANGDRDSALEVLQQGYEITQNEEIGTLIETIEAQIEEEQKAAEEEARRIAEEAETAERLAAEAAAEAERLKAERLAAAESGYEIGNLFPDFTMTDRNGAEVNLSDYQGKVLYINFFTTWCPYCYYELPDMTTLQENYGDQLQVVLIDLAETVADADAYAETYGITMPINHMPSWQIGDYVVSGVPESVVLDADGIIIDRHIGMTTYSWMQTAVEKALGNEK